MIVKMQKIISTYKVMNVQNNAQEIMLSHKIKMIKHVIINVCFILRIIIIAIVQKNVNNHIFIMLIQIGINVLKIVQLQKIFNILKNYNVQNNVQKTMPILKIIQIFVIILANIIQIIIILNIVFQNVMNNIHIILIQPDNNVYNNVQNNIILMKIMIVQNKKIKIIILD